MTHKPLSYNTSSAETMDGWFKNYCLLSTFCKPVNVICHWLVTMLYCKLRSCHISGTSLSGRMVIVLWQVCNFTLQVGYSHGPVHPAKQFRATGRDHACNSLLWWPLLLLYSARGVEHDVTISCVTCAYCTFSA